MKTKGIFFFLTIGLLSCEVIDTQNVLSSSMEDELKEVLAMPREFPLGKLKQVKVFAGDSENIFETRETYYPATSDIVINVLRNHNQDTVALSLNYFNGGRLETSHLFQYNQGKALWQSTREFQSNSENLIDKIFTTTSNSERRLFAQYYYNAENQLTHIEYPNEKGGELVVFEYDDLGKISKEWKSAIGQEDFKIDYLTYRYSNDLLVAKESGIRGSISEERQDVFQYFYDEQGRVVMQKEFDPYFGFQQKARSNFYYHEVGNH